MSARRGTSQETSALAPRSAGLRRAAKPAAAALPGRAHIGCSGWSYPGWRGTVYPAGTPARDWFRCYCAWFDTVELNATFYRLPTPATVDGWAAQAPEGFTYAVKVGQFGSHRRKLREPGSWLPNHLDRVDRLGDHLGPNLVQLPPRWHRDVARLDDFLTAAPASRRWAVEVRDRSWLHDDVFATLARHGAALCIHDLLPGHPWERTTDWAYLRFHGPHAAEHPYEGRYGGRRLWRVRDRLGAWLEDGSDVFAYFDNDQGGHAVADAAWLAGRLGARGASPAGQSSSPRT